MKTVLFFDAVCRSLCAKETSRKILHEKIWFTDVLLGSPFFGRSDSG